MEEKFRFNITEIAGALGDYGTLLPIVIGVAAVTNANLSHIFFFFALSYIATGLYYRLPMPIEPMKVIGVLAIGGSLNTTEIASAGLFMGLFLFIIAITGSMAFIKKSIPSSIIRGIQLGLGLTLAREAWAFIARDWQLGLISIAIIGFFAVAPYLDCSAIIVLVLGLSFGLYHHGAPPLTFFTWPRLVSLTPNTLWVGFLHGALPQLPLTLGNAALATSLLITDLFHRQVPERKLLLSMSCMCLIASPFGGLPMCHGAGGLAAQYRFGARTGGSNLISGALLLIVALFLATPHLVTILPLGALGALLFFSALEISKSSLKTDDRFFTLMTGALALVIGIAVAFTAMAILYWIVFYGKSFRDATPSNSSRINKKQYKKRS